MAAYHVRRQRRPVISFSFLHARGINIPRNRIARNPPLYHICACFRCRTALFTGVSQCTEYVVLQSKRTVVPFLEFFHVNPGETEWDHGVLLIFTLGKCSRHGST
jgi:hypothetical protein